MQSRLAQARVQAEAEESAASAQAQPAKQQQPSVQPEPQPQPAPPPIPPPQQQQESAQESSAVLRSLLGIGQPPAIGASGPAPSKRGAAGKAAASAPPPASKPAKRVMWADEVEEIDEPPVAEVAAASTASTDAAAGAAAFAARGTAAFRGGDYAAALSFYTEARLGYMPRAARAIGAQLTDASAWHRALQALSVRPNDAQLLCNRSAAAHGLGLFDAAHADAVAAAEVAPGRAQCHMRHGTAAAALRRWPEAAAAYERALAIKPGADDARQRLAMVQAAMLSETPTSKAAALLDVVTPPGVSPEPARASDPEDGVDCAAVHSVAEILRDAATARGESGIRVAAPVTDADADAAALAAALAAAARCGDALSARAAALAARVAQLEAELAAAHGAQCAHCGRCALPSYF